MFDLQHTLDLMEEGAYDKAASTLRQVIAQMPTYAPAYVLLAQSYEALERWPEALETWQHARFFAPNSPVVEAGLLRMLDRNDATVEKDGDTSALDVSSSDMLDRLADDLIETIREEPPEDAPTEQAPQASPVEATDADDEASAPEDEATSRTEGTPANNVPPAVLSPVDELADRLPPADQPLPADIQNLDRLIDELEGARIDPQPDLDDVPPPDLDNDIEDMVSETLARIYISQKQYVEAARIYQRLAAQEPEQANEYLEKAADMRDRARRGEGEEQ